MITDKTKEKFEEWWNKNHNAENDISINTNNTTYTDFYDLHSSMQWGVYLEFFDSVGIDLDLGIYLYCYSEIVKPLNGGKLKADIRKEAQKEAIKKANDLFNQSNR